MTLDGLLVNYKLSCVDLAKMDIEGAEVGVLNSCSDDTLRRVRQLTVEFHDFNGLISHDAARGVVHRLERLGFETIRVWMRSHGDTLFINRQLLPVRSLELFWSRHIIRNWWWGKRFVKRQFNLAS